MLLAFPGLLFVQLSCALGQNPPPRGADRAKLDLAIDPDKAAAAGLTPKEIAAQVFARLRRTPSLTPAQLGETILETPDGKLVRLKQVATIGAKPAPPPPPPADRGAVPEFQKGRVPSKVLIAGFRELWPGMAAAQVRGSGKRAAPITEEGLKVVVETNEIFWVTPEREKHLAARPFDDEYNRRRLAAALKQFSRGGRALTAVQEYVRDEADAGRLKAAGLEVAVRLLTHALREGRAKSAFLARNPRGSRLEFRLAPEPASPGARGKLHLPLQQVTQCRRALAEHGPRSGPAGPDPYAWIEAGAPPDSLDGLIQAQYEGKPYVLTCARGPRAMLHQPAGKGAWRLESVYRTADGLGRPALGFALDATGSQRLARLTGENLLARLAVVVDGKVLSAPRIRAAISHRGVITGEFTPTQIREMMWALEAGMTAPPRPPTKEP